jgi:cation transport ATPase
MQVKTIVFDKTGTLTVGKPVVVSAVLFHEFSMEVLCDMAISVEVFFLCCILYLFEHLQILYSH